MAFSHTLSAVLARTKKQWIGQTVYSSKYLKSMYSIIGQTFHFVEKKLQRALSISALCKNYISNELML
ncbi:hypothetical protein [Bacillus sp. MYb209]|uniref:hypothetical protein n=1 Tax=Bacillus sp. MYb209 TaxID=1848605 RepID=UPI00115933AA|nr:hypothetical protein [Bacillus sp. MYb209]